jgi:hypothetical protein
MSILPDSTHLTDHDDATVDEYRAVSGWAVASLVLGLLAPVALVDIWLVLIPLLGIVVALIALARIAVFSPALTGRNAAVAGLFLSVLSVSAAGADHVVYWRAVDREGRRFAKAWFGFLANEELYKAYQLTLTPGKRQPEPEPNDNAPEQAEPQEDVFQPEREFPRENEFMEEGPEAYGKQAVVRALLGLGKRAQVEYRETEATGRDSYSVFVRQVFAVSSDDAERGEMTFLVRLVMQRLSLEPGSAAWRMANVEFVEGTAPILEE